MKGVFFTDRGRQVPAVTADQMREVDRIAVEETGPNLYQMMENAGRHLAALVMEVLGGRWQNARVLVLAGTGGNGGGGICAARHLANRSIPVQVCLSAPANLSEVTAWQLRVFQQTSGATILPEQLGKSPVDAIIDALLGYSLRGAPRGEIAEFIGLINRVADRGIPVISLDVPSGMDATTGETPGVVVHPTHTLTLALPKTGLRREGVGDLFLGDLGIPEIAFRKAGIDYTSPFDHRFVLPLRIQ